MVSKVKVLLTTLTLDLRRCKEMVPSQGETSVCIFLVHWCCLGYNFKTTPMEEELEHIMCFRSLFGLYLVAREELSGQG